MTYWVVCYDIADDRRRRQVVKVLEGFGRRAQESVFECELEEEQLALLEKRLKTAIDGLEDDIRFYPMNRADLKRVRLLGRAELRRRKPYYLA